MIRYRAVSLVVHLLVLATLAVAAGFYLVLLEEPLIIWMLVATAAVAFRSIGSLQIMLINKRRLPPEFQMGRLSQGLLWFSFFTGLGAVGYWALPELPKRLGGG